MDNGVYKKRINLKNVQVKLISIDIQIIKLLTIFLQENPYLVEGYKAAISHSRPIRPRIKYTFTKFTKEPKLFLEKTYKTL